MTEGQHGLDGDEDGQQQGGFVRMRRQEKPQQGGADAEENVGQRVVDEGFDPAHAVLAGRFEHGDFDRFVVGTAGTGRAPDIEGQHDKAGNIEQTAKRTHDIEDLDFLQGFQKLVFQRGMVGIELTEHQALGNAGAPHGDDVEQDAGEANPEVHVGESFRPELGFPQAWGEPVEHAGSHEAIPAEGTGVDVADGPVGVMRDRVDLGNGHQRALERGHAVEGNPGDEKLDEGVSAEFIPGSAEGEQTVEHPAPGWCPQHEGEGHPEILQPNRQCGVEQMMGASPDVDEDQ